MRTFIVATAIAILVASSSAIACERDDPAKVTAVRFVRQNAKGAEAESANRSAVQNDDFAVTVDILSGGSYEPGLVLVASMDMIIAPRHLPTLDVPGKDIEKEVGWGVLASEKNLRAVVLDDLHPCNSISVETFEVALDRLIERDSSEDDELWPWVVRVQAMILDRNGSVVARAEGKMKNPWRADVSAEESPNTSLERTRER